MTKKAFSALEIVVVLLLISIMTAMIFSGSTIFRRATDAKTKHSVLSGVNAQYERDQVSNFSPEKGVEAFNTMNNDAISDTENSKYELGFYQNDSGTWVAQNTIGRSIECMLNSASIARDGNGNIFGTDGAADIPAGKQITCPS